MAKGQIENDEVRVMTMSTYICFVSGGARLSCAGRFCRRNFFFRSDQIRVTERLNQRIGRALRFEQAFLWLRERMQQLALRDVILDRRLRFMHSNHERNFAETNWSRGQGSCETDNSDRD